MRRLISLLAVISAAALSLVALTSHPARTQGTEPVPALRLDADGYTLGELVEGDAPPLERFHPDVLPARDHPVTVDGLRAPEGYTGTFRDYLTSAEIARFLAELAADHPTLLEVVEIGRSALGRPILAARVASSEAPGAIEDRPAIYVDGQHHSREMVTSQVVLYTVWWLLDRYGQDPLVTHIVDTRVTWLVPSVNPDGNDIALHDDQTARKTANPRACDDDGDGRFDEDPVRDYGYGTHTLTAYHFDPAWADAHVDDPFVADWFRHLDRSREPEELGRFTGALGGPMLRIPATDADGDRRFNEDDLGGTDPNRNYDFEWQEGDPRCRSDGYRGETAFSEAETQAVRDFVGGLSHLSTALSYHSGVDIILHPWGYSRTAPLPDAWLFERLGRKGSQLTEANGFPGSPHAWAARGLYDATGSTMDYLYGKLGAYALSPEVYGASSRTYLARLGATGTFTVGTSTGVSFNPRPDELLATTERWNRFALYLLAATPNVELVALAVEGDDLVATVGNDGALPVDVQLELVDADGVTRAARDPTRLWAEAVTTTWRIPLADLPAAAPIELRMRAVQPAATVAHEVERATWAFTLRGGAVELAPGSAGPLADLATHFPDGWWADERWDEPDRYHLPGSMPLPIDPPTPTPVSASATPAPATATPVSPTPDSSVTPEPSPTPTATAFPTPTASPPEPTPTPTSSPAPSATAPPTSPAVRGAAWLPVAFR